MTDDETELPPDALTPDPRNARRHGERNLHLIAEALKDVGAARSIIVDETGTAALADRNTEALVTPAKVGLPHSGTVKRGDRGGGASRLCDAMQQSRR